MKTVTASIYDFPNYYDLVFGSDTAAEIRFLYDCFSKYLDRTPKRLFEPACGTGRLIYKLGKQGFEVGGIDLNEKAVKYCNRRLERGGLKGRVVHGDMCEFKVKKPYDAAFNTINSFRHLPSEEAALAHFSAMAGAVRAGGIYVLGFHLTPTRGPATDYESWSAKRGQLCINTYMWPVDKKPRQRMERFGIRFDVHKPSEEFRIEDVLELRSYTADQFKSLVHAATEWELLDVYDFAYDITSPVKLTRTTEDIVSVFRRR